MNTFKKCCLLYTIHNFYITLQFNTKPICYAIIYVKSWNIRCQSKIKRLNSYFHQKKVLFFFTQGHKCGGFDGKSNHKSPSVGREPQFQSKLSLCLRLSACQSQSLLYRGDEFRAHGKRSVFLGPKITPPI